MLIQRIAGGLRAVALSLAAWAGQDTVLAADSPAQQCERPTVFLVNGVLNTRAEAALGAKRFVNLLAARGRLPHDLTVTPIYNPTQGTVRDLLEVAVDAEMSRGVLGFAAVIGAVYRPLGAALNRLLDSSGEEALRNALVVQRIKDLVLAEVRDRKRPVVLVAHSQGNLFVNEAVRQLKTAASTQGITGIHAIGVLGVGAATRFDPGQLAGSTSLYRHVTSRSDLVIGALTDPLPANFTIDPLRSIAPTISGHLFIDDYLGVGTYGVLDGVGPGFLRDLVLGEFEKVYAATSAAWPCVTMTVNPSPAVAGEPAQFQARLVARHGGIEPTGSVGFTAGGSPLCGAVVTASGTEAGVGESSCFASPSAQQLEQLFVAEWSSGPHRSSSPSLALTTARAHWSGKFWINSSDVSPQLGGFPLALGGSYVQPPVSYGYFSFNSGAQELIVGNSEVRRVFNETWNATDNLLRFSFPVRQGNDQTTQEWEFSVTSRTGSRLSGTLIARDISPPARPGGLPIVNQTGRGSWFAHLLPEPRPALEMRGYDLCYRSNAAQRLCPEVRPHWCFGSHFGVQNQLCAGFDLSTCQAASQGCNFGAVYLQ